ncbi:MAG: PqqD family protein [Myxococcota bacterium]
MTFSPDFVPRRVEGTEASRLGADFVLLDSAGKMLRGLNATGAKVWELIDGCRSAEEIAAHLASDAGAPLERVRPDVLSFLGQLFDRRLVTGGGR